MQMDICSHIGFQLNNKSLHGLCMDKHESGFGLMGEFSVDELAFGATKFLNIQDDVERVWDSMQHHEKGACQKRDEHGEAHQSKITTKVHENNDDVDITSESITYDDNPKSVRPHCSSAPSLPASIVSKNHLKPVSAMKGSREKRGLTPPKLTVKWAPDVYDPVPTPSLHTIINRPRKHGKKRSKSKQKSTSKSSQGSKSKAKRKVKKKNSDPKLCELKEEVIHVSEMDFHIEIPELPCGGSFVNTHGSRLHISSSVTEAT